MFYRVPETSPSAMWINLYEQYAPSMKLSTDLRAIVGGPVAVAAANIKFRLRFRMLNLNLGFK